jgi:hypothetical protein
VIAYKRESNIGAVDVGSSGMSQSEILDLEEMMESEEYDDGDEFENTEGDEEEVLYEQLVVKIMEQNKLAEIQRNFLLDKSARKDDNNSTFDQTSDNSTVSLNKTSQDKAGYVAEEDLYTPARSTWGVFQRPRDISKSYGGGRTLTKEDFRKMDEEFERREQEQLKAEKDLLSSIAMKESENSKKIREAVADCRAYMRYGNCKAAVKVLEDIQDDLSWQSDLGGEALLELG